MRLFIAIDLDEAVRAACERISRDLAERTGTYGRASEIKWIPSRNLHITVRFIGQVNDERTAAITAAMMKPLSRPPFELHLSHTGAFPPTGAPRVVWIGIGEGQADVAAVHDEIESRLRPLGFTSEDWPYTAHLTLARFRTPWRAAAGAQVRKVLSETIVPPCAWQANRVTVYESRLSPKGPTYHPMMYIDLGGQATGAFREDGVG